MSRARRAALALVAAGVAGVVAHDLTQRRHAVLRNFPVVGHLRYWLEAVGPELRQYIVTDNDQERPFTRDQRRWVYRTAERADTAFGFGTDNDVEGTDGYLVLKHAAFGDPAPAPPGGPLPCAKVLGEARGRRRAFRPTSLVNVSAMSFGSLSGPAVEALNRASALAGCLHNTGEGGISPHHRHGGDLVWQIGTGYFGCRDAEGGLSIDQVVEEVERTPTIRAIEIKLSQGAKAGRGGLVPGAKVTPEIARIRGVPVGRDVVSPPFHRAFSDVDGMIDVVERLADATGLPVGIKSAVGQQGFWDDLGARMAARGEGPDFVAVDGGEGGSGAAPLVFADHVSLPFFAGFPRAYRSLAEAGVVDQVVLVGAGKLGLPDRGMLAMALGCDLLSVGREAMLAVGCIQAQRCQTGHCPTGVATQSRWLTGGLDPVEKAHTAAAYLTGLRGELAGLARACGHPHPALVGLDDLELVDHGRDARGARQVFGYEPGWGMPSAEGVDALLRA